MTLKKLPKNTLLFSVPGKLKPRLRKAILKRGLDREFIYLILELWFNLTEGNVQLPEVVKQHTNQNRSFVRALAAAAAVVKKGNNFKIKRLLQVVGRFFTLLLQIIVGLVNSVFSNKMAKRYKLMPIELTLSPKEHFEDNLNQFIINETIADNEK